MFSGEYCKMFKINFLDRVPPVAASVQGFVLISKTYFME